MLKNSKNKDLRDKKSSNNVDASSPFIPKVSSKKV